MSVHFGDGGESRSSSTLGNFGAHGRTSRFAQPVTHLPQGLPTMLLFFLQPQVVQQRAQSCVAHATKTGGQPGRGEMAGRCEHPSAEGSRPAGARRSMRRLGELEKRVAILPCPIGTLCSWCDGRPPEPTPRGWWFVHVRRLGSRSAEVPCRMASLKSARGVRVGLLFLALCSLWALARALICVGCSRCAMGRQGRNSHADHSDGAPGA